MGNHYQKVKLPAIFKRTVLLIAQIDNAVIGSKAVGMDHAFRVASLPLIIAAGDLLFTYTV